MTTLTMTRGDTRTISVAVTLNGSAYDLTGVSLYFTAKSRYSDADADAIISKNSTDGGITITSAAGGLARVTIDPADTTGLTAQVTNLVWDLTLKTSDDEVYTVANGTLTVRADVTKAI